MFPFTWLYCIPKSWWIFSIFVKKPNLHWNVGCNLNSTPLRICSNRRASSNFFLQWQQNRFSESCNAIEKNTTTAALLCIIIELSLAEPLSVSFSWICSRVAPFLDKNWRKWNMYHPKKKDKNTKCTTTTPLVHLHPCAKVTDSK